MKNIVILISGGGSNMAAIVRAAQRDDWEQAFGARVRAVVSNRADAGGLAFAREQGLAAEDQGEVVPGVGAVATLRRRELLRVAAGLARETGKDFFDAGEGMRVEGVVARRLDLASGRFAIIENSREFSLVPWRPVLERAMGRPVSGIVREAGTSWTIGRGREIER